MQVAVIGAGVVGVCTAYFLAEAGHEVVVIERHRNVAEESSLGNAGLLAPGYIGPWAKPGMPRALLGSLFRTESPFLFKPTLDPAMWRWLRRWLAECELDRFRINKERMQRVAFYSRDLMHQLRDFHQFDYEQTAGYLQLFRTEREQAMAQPAIDMLAAADIAHVVVDAEGARRIEPALATGTMLHGGLYLPQDESGNCPLFTRQMRYAAQALGVEFLFGSGVKAISHQGNGGVALQIDDASFNADAVVVATGADSMQLLAPLGIDLPLYPVKGYSATATIKNFESAPLAAVMDTQLKVAVTRMGNRVRVAGIAELGTRTFELREGALRTLIKTGEDWFPDAANYHTASFWCGARPMLPDGPPILGATSASNVFVNIGHGSAGWAMAAGSAKAVADIVSGRQPDIDMEGLTLARYA